ncbi:MAG: hypothetical protein QG622_92 [Actinomycetota bacterium]|nr:hypothetical protein [Actinomycetota bacterium]
MALFRRRRRSDTQATTLAARRFWAWWDTGQAQVTAAAERADDRRLAALLTRPVRDIHPDLVWFVGPGVTARTMLVLSASRHPALRMVTERWRREGPPDSQRWEFHQAFPAEPGRFSTPVDVDGTTLAPSGSTALATLDDARFRMDLTVHHPAFADLDERDRDTVADRFVGWALGEDDRDRWVGGLATTTVPLPDGVPVASLGSLVPQLADRWGGERWAALEGVFGTNRLIASVRHPVHHVDHPLFDEHVAVRLQYEEALPDGQPTPRVLDELQAFQRHIVARLGDTALLVAVQTASGERVMHFYADSEMVTLSRFRAMLRGYTGGQSAVQAHFDPGWDSVHHLRVATTPD